MTDINFEELDQAVNQVMQSQPSVANEADQTATQDAPLPVISSEDVADMGRSGSVIATKRRGQFMDVVHPSSDMVNRPGTVAPVPRREALNIAPISPVEQHNTLPEISHDDTGSSMGPTQASEADGEMPFKTTSATSTEMPATLANTDQYSETPNIEREWPDPLDLLDNSDTVPDTTDHPEDGSTTGNNISTDSPKESEDLSMPVETPEADPVETQTTPFLANAPIEKRPLGANTTEDSDTSDTQNEEKNVSETAQVDTPQPELGQEVVAVEESEAEAVEDEPAAGAAATSITQQYTSSNDVTSDSDTAHSLYDTAQYHQPLVAEVRKSKNHILLYVILALVMVAIGCGVGYIVFVNHLI